ncbi:MAG: hypothetical protein LBM20_06735 [Rikenellaceae bacterium]|nr:hypothetical protein [Rikenellaceae bacterium]
MKWGLRFDTRFDNQEYSAVTQEGVISSKTDFSVRLAPVVGIAIDRLHSIMGGASFTFDMGAPHDKRDPEVLLYYNYRTPKFSAYAGKFERRRLVGGYSRAIYAESHTFYDHVIEGFAFQYTPDASKFELVLDWDGMQSPQKRESFRIISAGEWNPTKIASTKWFTAGYSFDMYHLASSAEQSEGVVDHILMNPYVGAVFNRLSNVWFQRLELSVGWLGSFDRERRVENVWEAANGLTVDFTLQKWNVGIHNHLYLGDKQFAYWDKYGSRVYRGDPFYSISGTYNYTRIYWRPRLSEGVSFDLSLEFPYDGSNMGFQQIAWIGVSIDSGVFDRKRKK